MDTSWLPGIEHWGARRIDRAISPDAAGGALVGMLLATPLGRLAAITAAVARHHVGPLAAQIAWYVGWMAAAYLALLVIAHWKQLDNS